MTSKQVDRAGVRRRGGMRRAGPPFVIAMLVGSIAVVVAGPAYGQDFPEAFLYAKPAGSTNYTYITGALVEGVAPGSSTTFQVKIVNVGTVGDQFRFTLPGREALPFPDNGNPAAPEVLSVNGTVIPSDTWITPFLAPGASQVVSVKVSVPRVLVAASLYGIEMDYAPAEETGGYSSQFMSLTVAQSSGSSPADVFAKTGNQPFVGGWDSGTPPNVIAPAETLAVQTSGSSMSATVRLQNDSVNSGTISLQVAEYCLDDPSISGASAEWPTTVHDGFKDVTATAVAGTYTTPSLAPNTHRDLRITVKNNSNPSCPFVAIHLTTSGQGQSMQTEVLATDAV